ncbi:hypothetical protein N7456_013335 [Penicillium angulare]|uniref:Transcription factor domain-containing protein n=1 Tax=Penicillium angulare TaxID=116970 RepID=A0A9W9EG29_9EURO|nr:hypothetical protein N7456_013335 [Penicillium angulare]
MSFILPILREPDLADIPELLQTQRPLVYCMAFVASRFVPGRSAQRNKSIQRNQLIPHILRVIQMRSDIGKYSEEQQWMVMQSLAILYTWASPLGLERISDDDTINTQLSHAELKSAVETTALSISLHRSAEDVMKNLQAGGHVLNSLSLHKYLYWLWLYSSAHRYSLLTSTPPTLREDTSIKLAPRILESLLEDHLVGRILAEIDLCLLWSQAALHQYSLGEWWSSLVIGDIDLSTLAVLEDLDGALDIWRQRWFPTNDSGSYARSGFIAFNYRFARLCISTYSVRLLREVSTEVPYSIQLEITMKSIQAASHFCAFITELPPLATDYLRYLADTAFLKIVYGCEYILRGCEILLHNENTTKYLDTVADVAQLMSQIAIDANHAPKVYGDSILEKVEHIRERLQNSQSDSRGGSSQDSADWASTSTFPGESDLVKALTFNAASIFPF